MRPSQRAVIVVFEEGATDVEVAMCRNGFNVFRHVASVVPVRGFPTDIEARRLVAKDKVLRELEELRQQRDEACSRLANVQAVATGPVLVNGEHDGPVSTEWRRTS